MIEMTRDELLSLTCAHLIDARAYLESTALGEPFRLSKTETLVARALELLREARAIRNNESEGRE